MTDLEEESLQRYSKDVAANRRCFFADILVSVTRGFEPSSKFGMETLTAEEQDAASLWLDSLAFLAFDDTKTLRNTLAHFCQEEQRWPKKDGGHALDRDLLTALGKVRSRRFGPVVNNRQGTSMSMRCHLEKTRRWLGRLCPFFHVSFGGLIMQKFSNR